MKEIELTQGNVALVDDEDFEMVSQFKWCARKDQRTDNGLVLWYAVRNIRLINGKRYILRLHRFVLQNFDMRFQVDHIDGNGLNNQKSNLRLCSGRENARNQRKRNGTSSKYKGVYWNKDTKQWEAQTQNDRKHIFLGKYQTEEEAAKAYNEYAKKNYGEFAKLNEVV